MNLKLTADRAPLEDALAQAARALPQSPVTPVLAGIRLHAADGIAEVSAFDYETSSLSRVPADVDAQGTAVVPGRLLAEIVRSLPGKLVEITASGTRMTLASAAARFTLLQLPEEDYPGLPEMPPLAGTVGGHAFATAVAQVAVATGKDHTLPMLSGIRVQISGEQLAFAATDRYRLALREMTWTPVRSGVETAILVPGRALTDAARRAAAAAELVVHIGDGQGFAGDAGIAGFAAGCWQTTTRLLTGEFPKVRKLIPDEFSCTAEVPAASFTTALKRVALVAERNTPVRMTFTKGRALLEAGTGDQAEASEELDVTFDDSEFQIALNPQYLADGLAAAGTDVARISMTTPTTPAVITGTGDSAGYRYCLMPVRSAG